MVATNAAEVTGSRAVAVSGLRIHVLNEGCSFEVEQREARIPGIKLGGDQANQTESIFGWAGSGSIST
jgi:hypothetical protein